MFVDNITLKYWHGGEFQLFEKGGVYLGGKCTKFVVDPDELCYWDLLDYAKRYGYDSVDGLFYSIPGMSLQNGLRKIVGDSEVLEMGELVIKHKELDVYITECEDVPQDTPTDPIVEIPSQTVTQPCQTEGDTQLPTKTSNKRKKLTPKKGPQTNLMSPIRQSPRKHKESSTSAKKTPEDASTSTKKIQKDSSTSGTHVSNAMLNTSAKKKSSVFNLSFSSLTDSTTTCKPLKPDLFSQETLIPSQKQPLLPYISTPLPNISTGFAEEFEWEDDRPESPLKWNELVGGYSDGSDDSDPNFDQEYLKLCEGYEFDGDEEDDEFDLGAEEVGEDISLSELYLDLEVEQEEEQVEGFDYIVDESDQSDDELIEARDRVKRVNDKLVDIAQQLQREACEGRLGLKGVAQSHPESSAAAGDVGGNNSDYKQSDEEVHTPNHSEEEAEGSVRVKKGVLVRADTDFSTFTWEAGQRFPNRAEFKDGISKYAVMQGKNVSYVVSNKKANQLGVKCVGDCPFYVYCSMHSRDKTWLVKTVVDSHTCHRTMNRNRQLKSTWLAKQLLEVFKARPHWPATEIIETVRRAYRVIIKRDFAYKVKYHAHKLLHGSMKEHYMKIERYVQALKNASPSTALELVVDKHLNHSVPIFKRLFVSFDGVKEGWKASCRRVICVDAAFLKTFLGGQIMSAVGRDPNDQMFPISWAAVEGESNSSWVWFFKHLQSCLSLGDGADVAILSDEHQAILHAIAVVLPQAEHRHCARHIFSLWHRSYKGDEMKLLFWKIAKAYNEAEFNEAWDELNELNPEAALAFKRYNPNFFCRAFLRTSMKTDAITNNMAETFNAYIINARTKHIIYMLEEIRVALMQRLVNKKKEMGKCTGVLCPRIQAKLEKEKTKAANCDVLPSSDSLFNVRYYLDQLNVDLVSRTCSCRKWDMVGIPCCHAIACIFFLNKEAEDYVDDCYKLETYSVCYGGSIPPCEGERYWPKVPCNLDPPPIKIGPGRPRRNRIKHPLENTKKPGSLLRTGIEMTCSICQAKGHNKRTCPDKGSWVPTEPTPKRPRGRPRNEGPTSTTIPASQMASSSTPSQTPATAQQSAHHTTTAQPSQLGRGGRLILGGQGAKGVGQAAVRSTRSGRAGRGSVGVSTRSGRGSGGTGSIC